MKNFGFEKVEDRFTVNLEDILYLLNKLIRSNKLDLAFSVY